MRIGIDISQIVHEGTGVATYMRAMVDELLSTDHKNEYVLFGASLRKAGEFRKFVKKRAPLVIVPIPPTVLHILWNVLHIIPVEWFIGKIDLFWSSDWTQPPLSKARGLTTIHDLAILRYPESFAKKILSVQKRKLFWSKKECNMFLTDSSATKKDVIELLSIPESKIRVVYPGL